MILIQNFFQIIRYFARKFGVFIIFRNTEFQLPGMQKLPLKTIFRCEFFIDALSPVNFITDHRIPYRSEMNAYLMSAAGYNLNFYKSCIVLPQILKYLVVGEGVS